MPLLLTKPSTSSHREVSHSVTADILNVEPPTGPASFAEPRNHSLDIMCDDYLIVNNSSATGSSGGGFDDWADSTARRSGNGSSHSSDFNLASIEPISSLSNSRKNTTVDFYPATKRYDSGKTFVIAVNPLETR